MILRRATADDARALAENSIRSYPNPDLGVARRMERYLAGPYPMDVFSVAEQDGRVVGQARTLPFRGWFGGVETAVGGLAGVAVAPEARRTGIGAALVRDHLARLRAAGTPWAMLYPFAARFYAAHGWAPAARRLRWRFAPSALPLFDERRRVRRLRLDDERDAAAARAAYERHCVAVNGSLARDPRASQFEWNEERDRRFAVGVGDGELSGYLVYSLQAPTPRPQTMVIDEWVALDGASERALLGFVAAQADHVQAVLLDTPVDHPLGALLDRGVAEREDDTMPAEHQPAATLHDGAMVRVVDVAGAIVARGWPRARAELVFECTGDGVVPENAGAWTLSLDDGVPRVVPGRAAGAPLVAAPIAPLSALLSGALRLADAARLGLVRVDGPVEPLDRLVALPAPYPVPIF